MRFIVESVEWGGFFHTFHFGLQKTAAADGGGGSAAVVEGKRRRHFTKKPPGCVENPKIGMGGIVPMFGF